MALIVKNLVKRFGGVVAVDGLSFEVPEGSVLGVIGPNGSGKSVTLRIVAGLLKATEGSIHFENRRIDGLSPHEVAMCGIAYVYQLPRLFSGESVLNNLVIASMKKSLLSNLAGMIKRDADGAAPEIDNLLDLTGLAPLKNNLASEISYGQQKLLMIAMAKVRNPPLRMLLLDEPLSGVNPKMGESIIGLINRIHGEGITVVVVEHKMRLIDRVCSKVIALEKGAKLAEGTPDEVKIDPRVVESFLGRGIGIQ